MTDGQKSLNEGRSVRTPHRFVHAILQVGLGTEDLVVSGRAQRFDNLCEEQEVVKQEAVKLLVALGFVQFATVQELSRSQAVGNRVEHKLLCREKKTEFVVNCLKVSPSDRVYVPSLLSSYLRQSLTLHMRLDPFQPVRVFFLAHAFVDLRAKLLGLLQR